MPPRHMAPCHCATVRVNPLNHVRVSNFYLAALQVTMPVPQTALRRTTPGNLPYVTPLPTRVSAISARHGELVEPQPMLLSRDLRHMMPSCSIVDEISDNVVHSHPPPAW
jgi:hypothetical protein